MLRRLNNAIGQKIFSVDRVLDAVYAILSGDGPLVTVKLVAHVLLMLDGTAFKVFNDLLGA